MLDGFGKVAGDKEAAHGAKDVLAGQLARSRVGTDPGVPGHSSMGAWWTSWPEWEWMLA